jgi:hypothetical protein
VKTALLYCGLALLTAPAYPAAPVIELTELDRAVLTAALIHFADSGEANEANPPGAIVAAAAGFPINPETLQGRELSDIALLKPPAPKAAIDGFVARNHRAYRFRPVVSLPKPLDAEGPGPLKCEMSEDRAPGVKTCVFLHAPGYSDDGVYALVGFTYLWSIHFANVYYLMRQAAGHWVVVATINHPYL